MVSGAIWRPDLQNENGAAGWGLHGRDMHRSRVDCELWRGVDRGWAECSALLLRLSQNPYRRR